MCSCSKYDLVMNIFCAASLIRFGLIESIDYSNRKKSPKTVSFLRFMVDELGKFDITECAGRLAGQDKRRGCNGRYRFFGVCSRIFHGFGMFGSGLDHDGRDGAYDHFLNMVKGFAAA